MKKGNAALPQVLIKWTNLPEDTATWEDWETLKARFYPSCLYISGGITNYKKVHKGKYNTTRTCTFTERTPKRKYKKQSDP
jgi:hypothetical protein